MSGFLGSNSSTGTTITDGYQGLAQTLFIELEEDAYSVAKHPNFSVLLAQNILTSGGNLVITFSASFGANIALTGVIFRILLDGVLQRSVSTGFNSDQITQSVSITIHRPVTSDTHDIEIEWGKGKTDPASASIFILAGTETNEYHASLLVQEVQ